MRASLRTYRASSSSIRQPTWRRGAVGHARAADRVSGQHVQAVGGPELAGPAGASQFHQRRLPVPDPQHGVAAVGGDVAGGLVIRFPHRAAVEVVVAGGASRGRAGDGHRRLLIGAVTGQRGVGQGVEADPGVPGDGLAGGGGGRGDERLGQASAR